MNLKFQFTVSALLLLSYGVALFFTTFFFTKNLGEWCFLFLLQPFLIWMVVSALHEGIPREIHVASKDNAIRIDGSTSSQRAWREQLEWKRVRFALYAVAINATLSFDWLLLLTLNGIIPVSLSKHTFPFIVAGILIWLLVTIKFVRLAYLGIIQDFYRGVRYRRQDYFKRDLARLQN